MRFDDFFKKRLQCKGIIDIIEKLKKEIMSIAECETLRLTSIHITIFFDPYLR